MIHIVFKNLKESQLTKEISMDRIQSVMERFPELAQHKLSLTVSMENSPLKPGPDLFTVKLFIRGKKYRDIVLAKSARTFYLALADLVEHTLERLNRFGDKQRVTKRNRERSLKKTSIPESEEFIAI